MNNLLRLAVPCEGETWVLEAASPAVLGLLERGIRRAIAAGRLRTYLMAVTDEAREEKNGTLAVDMADIQRGSDYLKALRRDRP